MRKVLVTLPGGDVLDTFFTGNIKEKLEKLFDTDYNQTGRQYTQAELRELLPDYDAVLTGWGTHMLSGEVLAGNERLKLIVHTGGSVGNLVDASTYDHGCRVFSGNNLYAESVAEGTIAYMLMAQRKIPDYMNRVRQGQWRTEADVWEGLLEKSVGIVGIGTISTMLIRMLQPFRVKIKVFSAYDLPEALVQKYHCQAASLDEIFSSCDIVTVHSALNDQNRGLICKAHFALLKENALFLNTSRGAVIDEQALVEELGKNRFRAVLDVYQTEPLAKDNALRSLPNVYAIPHMAGPTSDRRPMITNALLDEMDRFFKGEEQFSLEITRDLAARMTKM